MAFGDGVPFLALVFLYWMLPVFTYKKCLMYGLLSVHLSTSLECYVHGLLKNGLDYLPRATFISYLN